MQQTKRYLNTDIPKSIAELQAIMKEFLLKHRLYRLLLRGKGLEFESYRTYTQDDDASAIDWKASKRANNMIVRQYRDERNLKIVFAVDVSDNMVSGSTEKLKCEYVAEIVASFAHLIIKTGDRVGSIFFSDEIKDFAGPSGGIENFHRLAEKLNNPLTYGGAADLNKAFDFILSYLKKNIDSVVIVSDFVSFNEESQRRLSLISQKFEAVVLMVRDPLDRTLPDFAGEVMIQDPKTGQQLLINPKIAREFYERMALKQENLLKETCSKNNIDLLQIMTNEPFVLSLAEFLKGRIKKKELR